MNYDFLISTISLKTLDSIARQWHFVDPILNLYHFFINRFQAVADNKYRVLYCIDDEIRFSKRAKLNDTSEFTQGDCIYESRSAIISIKNVVDLQLPN